MKIPRWLSVVALLSSAALLGGCGLAGSSSNSGSGLAITTSSLPDATVSQSYTGTLQATGGTTPYTWSVAGGTLPTGLTLTTAGQITGTPTQRGSYTFQTQVTDAKKQSTSTNFSLHVTGPPPSLSGITPTTGSTSGGTSVTISGKNLQSGATVTFGGVPGTSVNVVNSSEMTAVTPPHAAGSVDVVVTNPGGNSATLSAGFGYGSAGPSVSAISPNSGPTTGGTAVKITGANFIFGAAVLFAGVQASSIAVLSSTQIQAVSPAGTAGAVNVTVKNPAGQTGTLTGGFTYNTDPTGAPTISSLSPNSGPADSQTVINGSNFASGATVSFGGTAASSVQFVSTSQLSVVVPSIPTGAVDVTVDDPGGASTTLASGFNVTTPQGLLSGCTVSSTNSVSWGSGACPGAVPSGWTVAITDGFDANGGSLANPSVESLHNQGSQWGTNIECTHAHTGSCAISAPYVADDMQGIWDLAAGALGSSTEVYVSWWEDESSGATHQDGGDFNLASVIDPTGNAHMWMDWFGQPNPPDGKGCLNGVGPSGDYNCQNGQLDLATNFNGTMQSQDQDYYGAMLNQNYNSWRQYEWHFKANTPGQSDGAVQLYVNGQMMLNYNNITLNRTISMVGMELQIGGVYTAYKNSSNSAGTDCVKPSGPYLFPCNPFSACSPCPIPPNFTRYWDDIIVLKK